MAGPEEPKLTDLTGLDAAGVLWLAGRADLTPELALALLRHPHCDREALLKLHANRQLHNHYEFRLEFTRHPRVPAAPAVQFLRSLFWRDQFDLVRSPKVSPYLQRTAMTLLTERIPEMTLGERITLAKIAPGEMLPALLGRREEMVLVALLDNPRLREGHVVEMLEDSAVAVTVVERIARHQKWACRHRVRTLLVRDPRLPTQSALRLVKGMGESELEKLANDPTASKLRAAAAEGRLGRKKRA